MPGQEQQHYDRLLDQISNNQIQAMKDYIASHAMKININYQANANITKTLLYVATERANEEAAMLLLKHGANPFLKCIPKESDRLTNATLAIGESAFDLADRKNFNLKKEMLLYYGYSHFKLPIKRDLTEDNACEAIKDGKFPFEIFQQLYSMKYFTAGKIFQLFQELQALKKPHVKQYVDYIANESQKLEKQAETLCNELKKFNDITKPETIIEKFIQLRSFCSTHNLPQFKHNYLEFSPKVASGYYEKSKRNSNDKKYKEAIDDLTSAITIVDNNSEYYYQRSLAYHENNELEKALEDCNKALQLQKHSDYYYMRASLYAKKGCLEEAMSDFQAAINTADNKIKQKQLRLLLMQNADIVDKTKIWQWFNANKDEINYSKCIKTAARLGNNEAQFLLGYMLHEGTQLPQDDFMALKWLSLASRNNHPQAQYILAQLLLQGIGVDPKKYPEEIWTAKASKLLNKSACLNNPEAKKFLQEYHAKISDSMKTETPIADKTRKLELTKNMGLNMNYSFSATTTKKRKESPLDLVMDHKHLHKRVRIDDTTTQGIALAEQAYNQSSNNDGRNNMVVNLSIVFSINDNQERTCRTIPINIGFEKNVESILANTNWKKQFKKSFEKRARQGIDLTKAYLNKVDKKYDKENFSFFSESINSTYEDKKALHSEQAFYEYLNLPTTPKQLLDNFIKQHGDIFKANCEICAIVINIGSNLAMCCDCKVTTIAMQNDYKPKPLSPVSKKSPPKKLEGFLCKFTRLLKEKGYKIYTKDKNNTTFYPKLLMVTRVRAGRKLKDPLANENIVPENKNIKDYENMGVLQLIKSIEESDKENQPYTLFQSGGNIRNTY